MDCKIVRQEIDELSRESLVPERIRRHLEICLECSGFRVERLGLSQLLQDLSRVEAPFDFETRLEKRLFELPASHRFLTSLSGGIAPLRLAMFGAALVVSFSVAAIYWTVKLSQTGNRVAETSAGNVAPGVESTERHRPSESSSQVDHSGVDGRGKEENLIAKSYPYHKAASLSPSATFPRLSRPSQTNLTGSLQSYAAKINSIDASSRAAQVLKMGAVSTPDSAGSRRMIVPLDSSGIAVKISFSDGNGAMQTVSMNPVTFGAQDIIQPAGSLLPAAAEKGIW